VLFLHGTVVSGRDGKEPKLKENPVKRALRAGKPQIGTWLSLGSIAAARFMAREGFPWLTVDMEHTHTDIQTASYMFGAIADAGCVPLARIPTGKHEYIKMVLDCGAMGIVAPMVMDKAEAEAIVAATKYPPVGNRSVGGGMHAINFGATADEYYRRANDEILVVIQTEHIKAVDIADEIYSVPGLDAVFVGPNDLSFSMKSADGSPPGKDEFEATLTRIREAAQRCKLPCGLHVFSAEDALKRAREGWQFIAVVSELKMMLDSAARIVRQVNPEHAAGSQAKY
jgi:4-hydroxy-2-oxoheptanedioate aldolase